MKDEILARIERELGMPGAAERLGARIQQADLHSLLLEVFRRRAAERTPAQVLADFGANRFVRPSTADPRALARFDAAAFAALPPEFEALELSPVCPLGTSSVLATVHQDKALTSIRSVEVLSDATNVLALECAARRKRSPAPVHLAASHRHLRTSLFSDPLSFAHFRLFVLVSAGRDARGASFHEAALDAHLRFYAQLLSRLHGPGAPRCAWRSPTSPPRSHASGGASRTPGSSSPSTRLGASGRGYYTDVCFKIHARAPAGEWVELGDGGGVEWTRKLLSNAKERLLISGISSERACALLAATSRP